MQNTVLPTQLNTGLLAGLNPEAADVESHKRTVQYFNELKTSCDGWKICFQSYLSNSLENNDSGKFFCFQVIEDFLKTRFLTAERDDHLLAHDLLLKSFDKEISQDAINGSEKSFVKNKLSQLFSLAFVVDYPQLWPNFFEEILSRLQSAQSVDLYLRVMDTIDVTITDREFIHPQHIQERNTRIKDHMRAHVVPKLFDSFYHILISFENSEPALVQRCLKVIGSYVSWVDISMAVNERFSNCLLKFIQNAKFQEETCDCVREIINKGMDPADKISLVMSLDCFLNNTVLDNTHDDNDGEFRMKIAGVINAMGVNVIESWMRLSKINNNHALNAMRALESKIPFLVRCLGDDDDDVSQSVFRFAQDYVSLIKQNPALLPSHHGHIKEIIRVVICKMRCEDSYNFEESGEDEVEFLEYRKQMKTILVNISQLDSMLLLTSTRDLLLETLSNWRSLSPVEIEHAVFLLYLLGEALPGANQLLSVNNDKSSIMRQMLSLLITSHVSSCCHTGVLLSYYETVVRYDKFFVGQVHYIEDVMMSFLDERGLRHSSPHVRSRCAYLFTRFVKSLKFHMQLYVDSILSKLYDLLLLITPDSGHQHQLSCNDQLFLYEAVGLLIVSRSIPSKEKQSMFTNLLAPIINGFNDLLRKMLSCHDEETQVAYAQSLNYAMSLASRSSKGFTNQQTMKQCHCTAPYTNMLSVFIRALKVPTQKQLIHSGVRQFLHRMVVCLEDDILPFIPSATQNLLENANTRDLTDFIPFLNQVLQKFKKLMLPFLKELFLPLVTTIWADLSKPIDSLDSVVVSDRSSLRKQYYVLLSIILNNQLTELFLHFDSVTVERVLMTLLHGAEDTSDVQTQKVCLSCFRKLIEEKDITRNIYGFDDFINQRVVVSCFMIPFKPEFDHKDAQYSLVLNECATCLKAVYDHWGSGVVATLNTLLHESNLPQSFSAGYSAALSSDLKSFKKYLKDFFQNMKT